MTEIVERALGEMKEPRIPVVKTVEAEDHTLVYLDRDSLEREDELEEMIEEKLTPRYSLHKKNHLFPFPDGRASGGIQEVTFVIRIIHRKSPLTLRLILPHLLLILLSPFIPHIMRFLGFEAFDSRLTLSHQSLYAFLSALLFSLFSIIGTCVYRDWQT